MLNMNVTAANLERLVETIVSWRRMLEMEQKSAKLNEVIAFQILLFIRDRLTGVPGALVKHT